jgi:hypothetical protein
MLEMGQRLSALEDAVERLSGLLAKHLQQSSGSGNTNNAASVSHGQDDTDRTDQR